MQIDFNERCTINLLKQDQPAPQIAAGMQVPVLVDSFAQAREDECCEGQSLASFVLIGMENCSRFCNIYFNLSCDCAFTFADPGAIDDKPA